MNNSPSDLAAIQARCEALQREREELARFALIGQAFLGLTHELNNILNSIMLQTSVVLLRADEQARRELAVIRQQGAQAAGLVRSLQHIVQERREKSYPVDLNNVLTQLLEEEAELRRRVTPHLAAQVPPIQTTLTALKQLVQLVLKGVCAGTKEAVIAATGEQAGGAALSITIAGSEPGESPVETLLWQNLDEVGRLAGQSLLRQLGGTLTAEQSDEGTLILRNIWAPSA